MTFEECELAMGLLMTIALGLGPWMFMVHAKLAVIAARIIDLAERIDTAAETNRELWRLCARHEARLDTHDVQLNHLAERLEQVD